MTRKIFSSLFVLLLIAGVAAAGPYFATPELAADNDPQVRQEIRDMERQGFVLTGKDVVAVNYFVQPTGDYEWGTITYHMENAGQYCDIAVTVRENDRGCYVSDVVTTMF